MQVPKCLGVRCARFVAAGTAVPGGTSLQLSPSWGPCLPAGGCLRPGAGRGGEGSASGNRREEQEAHPSFSQQRKSPDDKREG